MRRPMTELFRYNNIYININTHTMRHSHGKDHHGNERVIYLFRQVYKSIFDEDIEYLQYYKKSIGREMSYNLSICYTVLIIISYSGNYEIFKLLCTRHNTRMLLYNTEMATRIIIHYIHNYIIGDNLEILKNIIAKSFTINEVVYLICKKPDLFNGRTMSIDKNNYILLAYDSLLNGKLLI